MRSRAVPTYESKLTLQVLPYKPSVFDHAVDASKVAMYEGYIQSQAALIRSPILIDQVLGGPTHKVDGAEPPFVGWTSREFAESIRVEHPEDSQLIHVYFQDKDPLITKLAVNQIGSRYVQMHENDLTGVDNERLNKISDRINALTQQRDDLRASILALSPDTNIAGLTARLDVQTRFISTIERDLVTVRSNMASADIFLSSATRDLDPGQPEAAPPLGTLDDPIIRRYRILLAETEDRLSVVSDHIRPNHIYYQNSERLIAQIKQNIKERVDALELAGGESSGPDGMSGSIPWRTRARAYQSREQALLLSLEQAQATADGLKHEITKARTQKIESDTLYTDLRRVESDLEKTCQREEQLKIESGFGTYVHIINPGVMPIGPVRDPSKSMALIGCMAGAMLGIGLMLARTMLDKKCYHPGQLTSPPCRMAHQASIREGSYEQAAHDVHQARISLSNSKNPSGPAVIAIGSGDKNRSASDLTLSLAMSFAASGTDTLLIDLDSSPGNLTNVTDRLIVESIRNVGSLEPMPEDTAVNQAQKMADILCGLQSDQGKTPSPTQGIQAYMQGVPLKQCITSTSTHGLNIVRNEFRNPSDESAIPTHMIRNLFADAKGRYSIVLVCINQIDHSLASQLSCDHADRLLIHVNRGDRLPCIRKWIDRLRSDHTPRISFAFQDGDRSPDFQSLTSAIMKTLSASTYRHTTDTTESSSRHQRTPESPLCDSPETDSPC